ncbi:UbiE/COQ5 family methyltransferase [Pochonia chlamydosporia 170]|uniref:UbiE/COQ5 family methyltransferase n=1 Tax=Pochonia chlamydosporia 170 TaxID=1380566 RepID=A0A179G8U6_METCM|nr:UbiE/COQ5 family methyltransferase [Pochonia chlamydosporia 170]OAQ73948.1 UbiE/COQ5 family methyltransferase [Pochonia chlamydosporia 170]
MSASDKAFWDKSAKSYSKSKVSDQPGYERTLNLSKSYLNKTDKVLELGCGTGSSAFILAPSAAKYLATDISSEMIKIANEKHEAQDQVPGLEFRVATAEDVAKDGLKFNAVLGYNYLHLLHDPWGTVRTVRDMLEDGGLFISKTACLMDMNPLMRWVLLPVMQVVGKAPHVDSFTGGELRKRIEEAGFEILLDEVHASKGDDGRPFIVARKK